MQETEIRSARSDEREAVAACMDAAYTKYVPRIGKKPAPMRADYGALIARGVVWVIPDPSGVRGAIVFYPEGDAMFLENIAVQPRYQGTGIGRALMAFVEQQARVAGYRAIRLYTHEKMTENIAYYARLGFVEVERREEDGYARVFMRKTLDGSG